MNSSDLTLHIINNIGLDSIEGEYVVFTKGTKNFAILPNFMLHELLTKNSKDSYTRLHIPVLVELQLIRDAWGSGIRVTSSYRSPDYNKSINGATASEHAKGRALDIQPINGKIGNFKSMVKSVKKSGGRGYYKSFVHIDTGRTRTWQG